MLQNIQHRIDPWHIHWRKIHASLTTTTAHGSSTASQNLLGKKVRILLARSIKEECQCFSLFFWTRTMISRWYQGSKLWYTMAVSVHSTFDFWVFCDLSKSKTKQLSCTKTGVGQRGKSSGPKWGVYAWGSRWCGNFRGVDCQTCPNTFPKKMMFIPMEKNPFIEKTDLDKSNTDHTWNDWSTSIRSIPNN